MGPKKSTESDRNRLQSSKSADDFKRTNRPVQLCDLAYTICKPVMEKKGLIFSDLYIYWKSIVGEHLSQFTWPEKISKSNEGGLILHLRVRSPMAIEAQYSTSVILGKVNEFLGGNKIESIKIFNDINRKN